MIQKPSTRSSGVLLHPTSLPGRYGIGELGEEAARFVDFLAKSRQRIWQVLPLGPTSYGDSPYQALSAFAGNPMLISLPQLAADGWLSPEDLAAPPDFPRDAVDHGWVISWKKPLLRRAFQAFEARANKVARQEFETFVMRQAGWLLDFARFMAFKEHFDGQPWSTWEPAIRSRAPEALERLSSELADEIRFHQFLQHVFFRQWGALKAFANSRGIQMMGDLPIFVAYDSADVWANPELFHLDADGHATVVAGVPPDYFSETGQLWGNPLYRWDVMKQQGYRWWIQRLAKALALYDLIRVDHFRGFEAYWEVPADEETAVNGRWVEAPGAELFETLEREFGKLPIVAEDLGVITPEVEELRDRFGFPGMKILQFAFSDPFNAYLPHGYSSNCVVYTGTHDNDTTRGWYEAASTAERDYMRRYVGCDGTDAVWDLIRLGMSSVADRALFPMQDLLNLGTEARLNTPGKASGNWSWRFRSEVLTEELGGRLAELTLIYGRIPRPKPVAVPEPAGDRGADRDR
jgi:4-alpha-glucanotransferase